jgi:tRNA A58 N-methylase Trm61
MKLLVTIVLALSLVGCSALPKLGGVNTNAQVGKENTQQVVGNQENTTIARDQNNSTVQSGKVDKVVVQNIPPWVLLVLVLGWLLPTPQQMWEGFLGLFKRKNRNEFN